jgi:hypothetical protein
MTTHPTTIDRAQLGRLRWAVRAALSLGVAASVAANILHAQPAPIARAIAAWPPLALLLTVELVSRVPVHRRLLGVVRITATVVIAGIAAWVSYWHLTGVAARYGETGTTAYLLPISVDGLIVVASVCLVEIATRLHATNPPPGQLSIVDGRPGGNPPGPQADVNDATHEPGWRTSAQSGRPAMTRTPHTTRTGIGEPTR